MRVPRSAFPVDLPSCLRPHHASCILRSVIPFRGDTCMPHVEEISKFRPYVPPDVQMSEFTLRAIVLGLLMTGILGAANAYLGLKAGMTIAATYPAAVISMSVLRLMKGSLLEENIARTIGSIGESVAAGAVFTIPAFVLAGLWPGLGMGKYWQCVALMVIGGLLGILFVTLLRRVMVEDPELPFPESVAASEIHKAGQQGSKAAKILFANMGFGALVNALAQLNVFEQVKTFTINIGAMGKSLLLRTSTNPNVATITTGGVSTFNSPAISPAYLGVGYIIGPTLAALNFAGGVLAWGLMVPLLTFLLGPQLQGHRSHCFVGNPGRRRLLLDCAAYCGWRHAGRRRVYPVPHAFPAWRRNGPGNQRFEKIGRCTQSTQPDGTGPERKGGFYPAWRLYLLP